MEVEWFVCHLCALEMFWTEERDAGCGGGTVLEPFRSRRETWIGSEMRVIIRDSTELRGLRSEIFIRFLCVKRFVLAFAVMVEGPNVVASSSLFK